MNDELPRYCKALYLMGYFFYHTKINVFYLQQPPPPPHTQKGISITGILWTCTYVKILNRQAAFEI